MIPYNTLIIQLFTQLNLVIEQFTRSGFNTMRAIMEVPLGYMVVLYITIMGIAISQGWIQTPMKAFIKSTLIIGAIYYFGMNWDYFAMYIIAFSRESANYIGTKLLFGIQLPFDLPSFDLKLGIHYAVQIVFNEFARIGNFLWEQGSWRNAGPLFTAVVVWGIGFVLIAVVAYHLITALIMLSILFIVAPLFISFRLFEKTAPFFDRWVGAIAGYSFLLVLVSAVTAFSMSLMHWITGDMYLGMLGGTIQPKLINFSTALVVGLIAVGIVMKAASLAEALGGVFSSMNGGAMLMGHMATAYGAARMTAGSMRRWYSGARGKFSRSSNATSGKQPSQLLM